MLTLNTARPNALGAHTLPRLAPPVASFKFGRTGREWCIRSLRFRRRGGGGGVTSSHVTASAAVNNPPLRGRERSI